MAKLTKNERIDRALNEAESLSHQGRFPEARMVYEKLIKELRPKRKDK